MRIETFLKIQPLDELNRFVQWLGEQPGMRKASELIASHFNILPFDINTIEDKEEAAFIQDNELEAGGPDFEPGTYFIMVGSEFDRTGDVQICVIVRQPDEILSANDYITKLDEINKEISPLGKLMDGIKDYDQSYSPDELGRVSDRWKELVVMQRNLGYDNW